MNFKSAGRISTLALVSVFAMLTYHGTATKAEPESNLNSGPSFLENPRSQRAVETAAEGDGKRSARAETRAAEEEERRQRQNASQSERRRTSRMIAETEVSRRRRGIDRATAKAAERAARREADRAAKAAERAARREADGAAKAAERAARREADRAAKAAERAEQREADRILRAADRAAKKAARQAARKARQDARRTQSGGGGSRATPPNNSGRKTTYIPLDDPQCLAAVTQCSLLGAVESEMMPQWERTRLKDEMRAVYRQRHEDLRRLKQYVVRLIDFTMKNPATDPLLSGLCDTYYLQGDGGQDPGTGVDPTATATTASDPWARKTPKPSDPWARTTSVTDERGLTLSTTVDPWIKTSATVDPWIKSSSKADPWTKSSTIVDPWIKSSTTVDPWIKSSTTADPWIKSSTTADPWIKSSTTADPWIKSSTTADPWIKSSTTADPWIKSSTTADPWIKSSTTVDPWIKSSTTADPWTRTSEPDNSALTEACAPSEWTQWSLPYGFGTQERRREITQPGAACPQAQRLVERRNITSITEEGDNLIDDVGLVTDNFRDDFIRASEGKPRDFLLVLDSSGSISDEDFEALKGGAKLLIDSLCVGFGPAPDQHRLSIVQFSTFTRPVHSFASSQDPGSLNSVIDSLEPLYGYTCTGDALKRAFEEFDAGKGARNYTAHDTLIITDGRSNCGSDIVSASRALRTRSNVFALAVGLSSDPRAAAEITSFVSRGDPRHLFSLANFKDFREVAQRVRKTKEARQCQPVIVRQ